MSLHSSCEGIKNHMTAIKQMFSDNKIELEAGKAENEKSSIKILALEMEIHEMKSLISSNTLSISKHEADIIARKQLTQELKRKNSQLEEESVKKSKRNLILCEELKKISDKISLTRERTRQLDKEENKIRIEQDKIKPL